jgi:lipopolysaccharide export system protein LptC
MVARSLSTHSRIVAWTKIVLPLAALAILSSLFLFSKTNDPGKGVRLFDGDLAEFASKERITGPRFAGMTPSGVAIQISAREASPRSTGGPAFDAFDLNA